MSRIPPQGARLVGAWPGTGPAHHPRQPRPARQRRTSRSTWVARVLHPMQHPARLGEPDGIRQRDGAATAG